MTIESAPTIQQILAKNLCYFMYQQSLTVAQLSRIAELNHHTVHDILTADHPRGTSIEVISRLAEALAITPGDLVDDWQID